MSPQLVLSLFPGIGLLDMAFEEEGFCVVRGPDLLWGGDIRRFHPPRGVFDGVIGGSPCQAHSVLTDFRPSMDKYGDMTPDYVRVVEETEPRWFLHEQVIGGPIPRPSPKDYVMTDVLVRDVWVGGVTNRLRRFTFGAQLGAAVMAFAPEQQALHSPEPEHAVIGGHGPKRGTKERGFTGRNWRDSAIAQGLPVEWVENVARAMPTPLSAQGIKDAVGNGVPLPMGRAAARAVKRALGIEPFTWTCPRCGRGRSIRHDR